jgi:hypothetical protein
VLSLTLCSPVSNQLEVILPRPGQKENDEVGRSDVRYEEARYLGRTEKSVARSGL